MGTGPGRLARWDEGWLKGGQAFPSFLPSIGLLMAHVEVSSKEPVLFWAHLGTFVPSQ